MIPRTSGVTAHKGCNLSWTLEGSGPPVVLIQGMGVAGSAWRPQVADLAADYACLSFDNRGMGASQPVGGDLTVDLMAEDVLALMDGQGWQSAHLAGHSLGGLVALFVAQRATRRVRSLTLLSTFASGNVPTRMSWPLLSIGMRTRIGSRIARRNAFLELVMPAGVLATADRASLAAELGELFGHDLADQPPVVMKQFKATRKANATASLDSLRAIPTLVMGGSEDIIAPPSAGRAIAAGIPGARFVEVPNTAHGLPIHLASRVNELMHAHLDTAEAHDHSHAAR